ncbi:hypothetical protein ACH4VX_03925 [Streptomyces sp. NPDC020731]|uniref:hypothetical protein n=1 Tax=Streptomyces sp. NPDC020731 TaxID=3365085 RepID=UPI0037A00843
MSLTGVAAVLALLGIPVSVLVARWQMRTVLAQAEASHQTALAVAEANYRSALEVAEAGHRTALEVARNGVKAERDLWMLEARRAEYRYFQIALDQLRRAVMSDPCGDLWGVYHDVHDSSHRVAEIGPDEVDDAARAIRHRCYPIPISWAGAPREQRARAWETQITPLRLEFDEAVRQVISGQPGGAASATG